MVMISLQRADLSITLQQDWENCSPPRDSMKFGVKLIIIRFTEIVCGQNFSTFVNLSYKTMPNNIVSC
ncbi:unnamed protein product [Clavelina lepadiformis]|uniref:Uncharacterized protein n=1 Tax=Clavelina lepadiformis TaxID=159417 RepID=A0ABP0GTR4_CLALP